MGDKVENTEYVVKGFPGHGSDFYVETKFFLCPHKVEKTESV